jgi:hypothetical protein
MAGQVYPTFNSKINLSIGKKKLCNDIQNDKAAYGSLVALKFQSHIFCILK